MGCFRILRMDKNRYIIVHVILTGKKNMENSLGPKDFHNSGSILMAIHPGHFPGGHPNKGHGDVVASNELPRVSVGRMVLRRLMTPMSSGSGQQGRNDISVSNGGVPIQMDGLFHGKPIGNG